MCFRPLFFTYFNVKASYMYGKFQVIIQIVESEAEDEDENEVDNEDEDKAEVEVRMGLRLRLRLRVRWTELGGMTEQ